MAAGTKKTAGTKKAAGKKKAAAKKKGVAKKKATRKAPVKKQARARKQVPAKKRPAATKKRPAATKKQPAAAKEPSAKKQTAGDPKSGLSSLTVNLGHVFALRPRVSKTFQQTDFLAAKRLLDEESYASIQEAARAVVEKALELTHDGPPKRGFRRGR